MSQALIAHAEPQAMAPTELDTLRSEIDRIDDELLELMERRLASAAAIARLKTQARPSGLLLRPDRERDVLDRLARRARHIPAAAVRMIWRELMGLSLQAQRRTELVVCAPQRPILVTDRARVRFGCQAPILAAEDPAEALERARTREAIAVIELSPLSSWWTALSGEDGMTIFDCLTDDHGRISALLVGRLPHGQEGRLPLFPIISEGSLRRRMSEGEAIQPLAMSGGLRLCISHGRATAR